MSKTGKNNFYWGKSPPTLQPCRIMCGVLHSKTPKRLDATGGKSYAPPSAGDTPRNAPKDK
jgi:hypothetical protein